MQASRKSCWLAEAQNAGPWHISGSQERKASPSPGEVCLLLYLLNESSGQKYRMESGFLEIALYIPITAFLRASQILKLKFFTMHKTYIIFDIVAKILIL